VRAPLDVVSFSIEYPPDTSKGCGPCPPPGPRVLEHDFRPGDVGSRVVANVGSDPDFPAFVALLTNNRPDEMLFLYTIPPGGPENFSGFGRSALDTALFPIDWRSYRVTGLSFHLTEFTFDPSSPTNIGGITYYFERLAGDLEVMGNAIAPTPEPATLTILATGVVVVGFKARRRRKTHQGSV